MKFLYWQEDSELVKEFTYLVTNAEFQRCESFDDLIKNHLPNEVLFVLADLDLVNQKKSDLKPLKKAFKKIEDLEVIYLTNLMESKDLAKHQTSGVGGTAYFKGPLTYDEIAPVLEQIFELPMMSQEQQTSSIGGMTHVMGLLEKERNDSPVIERKAENLTSSINLKFEEAFGANFDFETFDELDEGGENPIKSDSSEVSVASSEPIQENTGVGLSDIEEGLDIGLLAENDDEDTEENNEVEDSLLAHDDGGGVLSEESDDDLFKDGTDDGTETRIDPLAIEELTELGVSEDGETSTNIDILEEEAVEVLGEEESEILVEEEDESSQIFEALTEDISGIHTDLIEADENHEAPIVEEYDESKVQEVEDDLNLEEDFALSLDEGSQDHSNVDLVNELPEGEVSDSVKEEEDELTLGDEDPTYEPAPEDMISVADASAVYENIDFEDVRANDEAAFEEQSTKEDPDEISIKFNIDAAGNDDGDDSIEVLDVNGVSVDTSNEDNESEGFEVDLEQSDEEDLLAVDELEEDFTPDIPEVDSPDADELGLEFDSDEIGEEDSTRVYQAGEETDDSLITQFDEFSEEKEEGLPLPPDDVLEEGEAVPDLSINPMGEEDEGLSLDGLEFNEDELGEADSSAEVEETLEEEEEEIGFDFTNPALSIDVLTPENALIDQDLAMAEGSPDGGLLAEIEEKTSFIQKAEELDAQNEIIESSQVYEYSDDVKKKLAEIDGMLSGENFVTNSDSSISNHPLSNVSNVQNINPQVNNTSPQPTQNPGLISQIRGDHLKAIEELSSEKSFSKSLERDNLQLKAIIEEKAIEFNLYRNKNNQRIIALQSDLDLIKDQNKRLLDKNNQLDQQLHQVKKKFQINMENPETNRSDLEQKLELIKVDSESQIRNRDKKILELKRKIDMLEFDMESLLMQEKQMNKTKVNQEDRHQKILHALEIAFKLLSEEQKQNNVEPILPSKKNLNA
ncbi:hypothetical protein N9N67_01930 [Bacteriovoracaceae bacterium]|nr:hypothetical protein [Bacteriovoracaceae bacterium]